MRDKRDVVIATPTNSLEQRILAFTAKRTGTREENIRLDSRLVDDLGLDGDDAVDFFEAFGKEFAVELTDLQRRWDSHFGPEGFVLPFWPGAFYIFVIVIVIACKVSVVIAPVFWWVLLAATIVLGIAVARGWSDTGRAADVGALGKNHPEITIRDLIESAKAGKWVQRRPEHDTGN